MHATAILSDLSRPTAIWTGERPAISCLTTSGSAGRSCCDISVGEIPMVTFLVEAGPESLGRRRVRRAPVTDHETEVTVDDGRTLFGSQAVTN